MDKKKDKKVDEMGIRLAPTPMRSSDTNQLPSIRQDFVLRPSLEIDEPQSANDGYSTVDDFQPKNKDISKKYKRRKWGKNFVCGVLMLLAEAIILLPYIFAATSVNVDFVPFKYVLEQYNAIGHLVDIINNGGNWLFMIPDFVLMFGLLFVVLNVLKSLFGIFGAIKVKKYTLCSMIYFFTILAVFISALVGIEQVAIYKIDFMNDVIYGWQTSEWFTLLVTSVFGILMSVICSFINPDKSGYIR